VAELIIEEDLRLDHIEEVLLLNSPSQEQLVRLQASLSSIG
jgi:hypothetical protein